MTHTTTTLGGERGGLHPLLESGVIAVARLPAAAGLRAAARALAAGGVGAVEITLTTPGPIEAIGELASDRDLACVVGAGTVLDESAACEVIDAGARFVSLENVGDWIRAGAAAVSVGSALLPAALVRSEAAGGAGGAELTLRARAFVERVAQARAQLAGGAA